MAEVIKNKWTAYHTFGPAPNSGFWQLNQGIDWYHPNRGWYEHFTYTFRFVNLFPMKICQNYFREEIDANQCNKLSFHGISQGWYEELMSVFFRELTVYNMNGIDYWNMNVIIKRAMGISYLMLTIFSPTYSPYLSREIYSEYLHLCINLRISHSSCEQLSSPFPYTSVVQLPWRSVFMSAADVFECFLL